MKNNTDDGYPNADEREEVWDRLEAAIDGFMDIMPWTILDSSEMDAERTDHYWWRLNEVADRARLLSMAISRNRTNKRRQAVVGFTPSSSVARP